MKQAFAFAIAVVITAAAIAADAPSTQPSTQPSQSYKLLKTLSVGGEGGWDYLTVDPDVHRLYVARSTHVQVLDADSGKLIHDFQNTPGVHGIAIVPEDKTLFTSNGQSNNVTAFYSDSFRKRGNVRAGHDPDFIINDPSSTVLVANHDSGTITFIFFFPKTLEIGGTLEAIAIDGNSHAWVNVEDKSEVVEFDTKARKILNRFAIIGGEQPTGLAMDPIKRRLFIGCRGNSVLIVMNCDNGNVLATLPIGQHCDGVAFDSTTNDIFASCGDGTLAVIHETSPDKFEVIQTIQTKPGARTMALDPKSHQIYLPTAEFDDSTIKPDTFEILVVGK